MINNIYANGNWIEVSGVGTPSILNYQNTSMPGNGMVRFNNTKNNFEVFDGLNWHQISNNTVHIGLTYNAQHTLEWAHKKMQEEHRLEHLANNNTAIKDLLEQKKSLDEKLKLVEIITRGEGATHGGG